MAQTTDRLTLGERIVLIRRRLDMSLTELSAKTGVPLSTLSRYEHGKRQPPAHVLGAIAAALGTTPNDLLDWEGTPTRMTRKGQSRSTPDLAYALA